MPVNPRNRRDDSPPGFEDTVRLSTSNWLAVIGFVGTIIMTTLLSLASVRDEVRGNREEMRVRLMRIETHLGISQSSASPTSEPSQIAAWQLQEPFLFP